MSKLLPCPFCGEEARIERIGDRRQSTLYACNWCSCSLETGEEWDHGKEWNTRPVPDVTELVRYSENNGLTNFTGMQRSSSGDYVRFDQAEGVIAAERAEANHQRREQVKEWERANALEAENAAKDARIKELELLLGLAQSVHRWNIDSSGDGILYVCKDDHDKSEPCEWSAFIPIERAEADNKRLREALVMIARIELSFPSEFREIARAALEAKP